MANRVPLIVDTTNLHLKELPLGDALDLTGCSIVGLTSFTPGSGGGQRFIGITTFGDGTGAATTGVYVNDGLLANYLKASNLTDNQVVTAGAGGSITASSNLTFDESTLAVTGAITASTNLTVTGNAVVNGNVDLGDAVTDSITPTGRFDAHIIPLTDDAVDLGASGVEFKDLYIDGTANIDSLSADTAIVGDLTDNRVVIAGSGGELEDSGNLTFDGSTLTVTGDLAVSGNLNYTNVTDIYSVGIITAASSIQVGAGLSVAGISTFTGESGFVGLATFGAGIEIQVGVSTFKTVLNADGGIACDTDKFTVADTSGNTTIAGTLDVDGQTDLDVLNVAETATFSDDVQYDGSGAGISSAFWDKSANEFKFKDNVKLSFGDSQDLSIHHNGANSFISDQGTGELRVLANVFTVKNAADDETMILGGQNGAVTLYNDNNARVGTTTEGADISGPGALKIPVGNSDYRPTSPVDGDIRYNNTLNSYEGYGNGAWGGLGGGTEIDVTITSTSAQNLTTFAKADYRSASLRVQIVQGSAYQVGRYLLIHDGTTATIVEEAAIATGSMLGTISAAINGSNVEVKVTMGSASSATVTTIIDKITV